MSNFIVTTTINPITKAIELYQEMKEWNLIVVGDLKTPKNYKLKRGIYLSPNDQEKIDKKLSNLIGWNCIQRRNFGFILAKKLGAKIIATIDDDNIPLKNWGKNLLIGTTVLADEYQCKNKVFDPLSPTNHKNLWHRGYPLQIIKSKNEIKKVGKKKINPDIQADFWNIDPDVDAIQRLLYNTNSKFNNKYFPFFSKKISPFNSQNTFLKADLIKNYFMFPHIGRMDDIWGAYYLLSKKFKVIYNKPTVNQKRNVHDYTIDFKNETLGYLNNMDLINSLENNPENIKKFIPEKSYKAFKQYQKNFK
ncbi:hypothetical protein OAV65_01710 [Candidatus Pelagibacter sp.]|jgi:hypothetical protein|nr:hypothetical protein [Candidatus Pelagibacter sp.]MDC3349201.1 hypothetical protein [Candidatus Pelagibacter sp.]